MTHSLETSATCSDQRWELIGDPYRDTREEAENYQPVASTNLGQLATTTAVEMTAAPEEQPDFPEMPWWYDRMPAEGQE